MKSRQVPFFLYRPVENVQFCINSIGHLGWLSGISDFPRFHKNVRSLDIWKYISENTSPKGSFWRNQRKSEFSDLSSYSPYLQAANLYKILWSMHHLKAKWIQVPNYDKEIKMSRVPQLTKTLHSLWRSTIFRADRLSLTLPKTSMEYFAF